MTAETAENSGIRNRGVASRLVVFVSAIAFVLQSFIAQTHIHARNEAIRDNVEFAAVSSPAHGKTPINNGTQDCPFCQAIVHAGAFLTPTPPFLALPVRAETAVPFVELYAVHRAATHNWHSRAPPQH